MEKALTIVARIEAKKEHIELVKSELIKLNEPTHKEEGCNQYDLHQDNDHPELFVYFEKWASKEIFQRHLNSDHIAAFMAATEGAVENFTIHELTLL